MTGDPHVDFERDLGSFYFDACGFRPTEAGLIHLPSLPATETRNTACASVLSSGGLSEVAFLPKRSE